MSRGRGTLYGRRDNEVGNKANYNQFSSSREVYNSRSDEVDNLRQPFNGKLNVSVSASGCSEWDDWDRESSQATNQTAVVHSQVYTNHNERRVENSFSSRSSSKFDEQKKPALQFSNIEGDDPHEMKISSRLVGLVIGKGGSRIKELRLSSGAQIEIEKVVDNSGWVTISLGGDSASRMTAKTMIDELIASDSRSSDTSALSSYSSGRQDVFPSSRIGGQSQMQGESTEIYVPTRLVGRIIGKAGSKIKEIQLSTGAYIKINDDKSNEETKINITGNESARLNAKQQIEELVDLGDVNGLTTERNSFMSSNQKKSPFESNDKSSGDAAGPRIDWDLAMQESDRHQKIKWDGYPQIKKNFYFEDPEVANLEPDEVAKIRFENNNIMVQNFDSETDVVVPNPITTFEEGFAHYPEILSELKRAGFSKPSPIQMQSWPIALQGLDLIGIAQTGTGKTLAFLLPAFIHIEGQPVPREKRMGPNVLVLSPTRELAIQIEQEVKKYKYRDIKCVCIYGGGSRREQINVVSKGVEIVVATPGRLNDLIMNNIIDVRSVTYLVLDEADRMLDLGFEPEIRKILIDIRPDRQTIMTSATWPEGVRRLAKSYMSSPIQVFVGSLDLTAVHSVYQRVEIVAEDDKRDRLVEFLTNELGEEDKVIVFMARKCAVDNITADFALSDIRCQSIHGGREQYDREQALEDLKNGTVKILIATDVASRGLDIKDITHVLNYDFPHNIEEYVHRVGRTGRAGRTGESITFMTRNDWRHAADLIKIMEEAQQEVPQEVYEMAKRFSSMQERRKEERSSGYGNQRSDFSNFDGFGGDFGSRPRRGGRRDDRCVRSAYM